jgi:hypothetical protein
MGNILKTCPDGILLSNINLSNPDLSCINVKYVVVGAGDRHSIVVSGDGNQWVGLGKTIFSTGNGITYNNIKKLWVAVGAGDNSIATSNNGMTWTGLGKNIFTTGNKVKYANNLFVAVGTRNDNPSIPPANGTNTIATSTDGTIWTIRKPSFLTSGSQITYGKDSSGNNLWVVLGSSNYNSNIQFTAGLYTRIMVSRDNGVTWSRTVITPNTGNLQSISESVNKLDYGNKLWLGEGQMKYIERSTNGTIWTERTGSLVGTIMTGDIKGIAYDRINNVWVLVGTGTNQIAISRDAGVTWNGLGKTFFTYGANFLKYANDTLFVGNDTAGGGNGKLLSSTNGGTTWNSVNNFNFFSQCNDIEYATPLLECANTIGYSGTTGECTCASGYSGTVTYRDGVLGGCTAIPCTTTGYSGTAGACTCANGYSGTVTYTNGVLGGCLKIYSYTLNLPTNVNVNSIYTYQAININNASNITISYLQIIVGVFEFMGCNPEISFNTENKFFSGLINGMIDGEYYNQYIGSTYNPSTKFIPANSKLIIRINVYSSFLDKIRTVGLNIRYG